MSKASEDMEIDSFTLSDGVEAVEFATEGELVSVYFRSVSRTSNLLFRPDEAERIGCAMLKAAAHIDPTRAQRIAVYLRGAGLTP